MTTTLKVTTHDWPVEIRFYDGTADNRTITTERMEPHSERTFHPHDTRSIRITELPKPE